MLPEIGEIPGNLRAWYVLSPPLRVKEKLPVLEIRRSYLRRIPFL